MIYGKCQPVLHTCDVVVGLLCGTCSANRCCGSVWACLSGGLVHVGGHAPDCHSGLLSTGTAASGGHCPTLREPAGLMRTDKLRESLQAVSHLGASMATAWQRQTSRPVCRLCRHRRAEKHATGRHAPGGHGGPPATSTSPPGWLPAAAAASGFSAGQPAACQPTAATPWGGPAQPAAATPWAGPAACPAGAHAAAAAPCL